jgi:hypothetical protein
MWTEFIWFRLGWQMLMNMVMNTWVLQDDSLEGCPKLININHAVVYQRKWNLTTKHFCSCEDNCVIEGVEICFSQPGETGWHDALCLYTLFHSTTCEIRIRDGKIFLGYQLHQLVKNYQHCRDHHCPHHQGLPWHKPVDHDQNGTRGNRMLVGRVINLFVLFVSGLVCLSTAL